MSAPKCAAYLFPLVCFLSNVSSMCTLHAWHLAMLAFTLLRLLHMYLASPLAAGRSHLPLPSEGLCSAWAEPPVLPCKLQQHPPPAWRPSSGSHSLWTASEHTRLRCCPCQLHSQLVFVRIQSLPPAQGPVTNDDKSNPGWDPEYTCKWTPIADAALDEVQHAH